LTETIAGFVNELSLRPFVMYVFDYGAPVGFNLAVTNPDSITAIISQNGNVYEEGLGTAPWEPLRAYWTQPSPAIREKFKERMSLDGVREAYFQGVSNRAGIEPEAYWLDAALLARPGMMDLQADLELDYKSNIERYPLYQQYLRTHRPPLLAIWGKNDAFFIPLGAEAFKRDVPDADVRFGLSTPAPCVPGLDDRVGIEAVEVDAYCLLLALPPEEEDRVVAREEVLDR
jgi:pimeloyl-ACP methyl ester carboxylesterase